MVRSSRGILCVFVVWGSEKSGQERDLSGTQGSGRRDPASLCSGRWAVQGTTRTHATHLDTICLSRPVSIPLSLVSCLSRLLSLACRASLVSCVTCSVSALLLSSLSCLVVSFPLSVRPCVRVCACLSLSVRLSVLPVCSCEESHKCASLRVFNVQEQRKRVLGYVHLQPPVILRGVRTQKMVNARTRQSQGKLWWKLAGILTSVSVSVLCVSVVFCSFSFLLFLVFFSFLLFLKYFLVLIFFELRYY